MRLDKHRMPIAPMVIALLLALAGCGPALTPENTLPPPTTAAGEVPTQTPESPAAPGPTSTPRPSPTRDIPSPTPNPTRPVSVAPNTENHLVQYGESLGLIADQYGTTIEALMELNGLANPDAVRAGQTILVPAGQLPVGPADKLIPDSELVYGPAFSHFDVTVFAEQQGGYLTRYTEEVEERILTGPEIVQLVAQRFSVGPRVLLALLELKAGWVTETWPAEETLYYPMGKVETGYDGLFIQLSWTANQLNRGYYGWEANWLQKVELADGRWVQLAPELNAGTAAVQVFLALHDGMPTWESRATWDGGLMAVYRAFFGNPFRYAVEPLIPADLEQPTMVLPWRQGELWWFTGGPHGGWGSYSGWAALDFVPADEQLGCYLSEDWVRAVAPGRVIRSENGEVVVDMDDDGFEGTGWTVLYLHIGSDGRVPLGTWVEAGDKIGHPACEGGFTIATHLHIARRYNGRWGRSRRPHTLCARRLGAHQLWERV